MVHDVVVDTLDEDVLEAVMKALGQGRLIRDPEDPEEPYLTEDGYLVVRIRDTDPIVFSREIQRRVMNLRIVGTYDRTPK